MRPRLLFVVELKVRVFIAALNWFFLDRSPLRILNVNASSATY